MKIILTIFFILTVISCNSPNDIDWDSFLGEPENDSEVADIDTGDTGETADTILIADEDEITDNSQTPDISEQDTNLENDIEPVVDEDSFVDEIAESDNDTETPDEDGLPETGSMVTIPGNSFWQGCRTTINGNTADPDCSSNESPYHQVSVPSFKMDVYEVTNSHYIQFLNKNGNICFENGCVSTGSLDLKLSESGGVWSIDSGFDNFPVVEVTWYGAKTYCEWAGKRLPSESEWELAARGTDERLYPWGDETATCDYAVMNDEEYGCETVSPYYWAVGSKPNGISPYGLFDMAGNVREWVEDDWHDDYSVAGRPDDGSAWIDFPARWISRVLCGGSWKHLNQYLRASYRFNLNPELSINYIGFRCASDSNTFTVCGNGKLEYDEDCDDGNTADDGNGCSETCTANNVCGNGTVESVFEYCDDGNATDDDNGCDSVCKLDPGYCAPTAAPTTIGCTNNAAFVSQTAVPTIVAPGETFSVAITMNNNGDTAWGGLEYYRLGTQNPGDNTIWTGSTRVEITAGTVIQPGGNHTFVVNATAPATPGIYNFQYRMVLEGVEWFGTETTNVSIRVVGCGNGVIETAEDCDDGNETDDGNGCSETCEANNVCGNGTIESAVENCDDGNETDDGNGCSETCKANNVWIV